MIQKIYSRIPSVGTSRFWVDLEALAGHLQDRGHRPGSISGYLYGAAHLASCIERGLIPLKGLTAESLQRFARQHIKRCACPSPNSKNRDFVAVAPHLFAVLKERHGLVTPMVSAPADTPVRLLLSRFEEHLRDERGLRESTREVTIRNLRPVLEEWCGAGRVDVAGWTTQQVRDCIETRARRSLPAAKVRGAALRSFFRFLILRGEPVGQLLSAVPAIRCARLAGLPRGLSKEQLLRLVGSIDINKPIGLRTCAIIECLVGLGLRAGEVAALRLQDIDWRAGTLRVNTTKVRRSDVFPLAPRVGRALVAYLTRGRPRTADGHVFVRHYLPVGAPLNSSDVTSTVRRAFKRAGLLLPSMGAHVLRHTTACRLVRAGVSIKEIADLMRHRDINTTRIYAKVDWPRLAEVALPWPTTEVAS